MELRYLFIMCVGYDDTGLLEHYPQDKAEFYDALKLHTLSFINMDIEGIITLPWFEINKPINLTGVVSCVKGYCRRLKNGKKTGGGFEVLGLGDVVYFPGGA